MTKVSHKTVIQIRTGILSPSKVKAKQHVPRRRSFFLTHCANGCKQAGGAPRLQSRPSPRERPQPPARTPPARTPRARTPRATPKMRSEREMSFTRTRGVFCVRPALFASRARPNALSPTPPLPNDCAADLVTVGGSGPWVAHPRALCPPPFPGRIDERI